MWTRGRPPSAYEMDARTHGRWKRDIKKEGIDESSGWVSSKVAMAQWLHSTRHDWPTEIRRRRAMGVGGGGGRVRRRKDQAVEAGQGKAIVVEIKWQ